MERRTGIPWDDRGRCAVARGRRSAAIRALTLATCAACFGTLSLLLILAAFADIATADYRMNWLRDHWEPDPPTPADFYTWVRDGSPLDCLLTSDQARLRIDSGFFGGYSSRSCWDAVLEISVAGTTTVRGHVGPMDADEEQAYRRFRADDLPSEAGRRHFLDIILASRRPDTAVHLGVHGLHSVSLRFWCDGHAGGPIKFSTSWGAPDNERTHGVLAIAASIMDKTPSEEGAAR
jgi:hypothetical protein